MNFVAIIGQIHQYRKVPPLFKKNLGGARVGTYSVISSVMGLEAQKNLGLLMCSEVEGGSSPCFYKTAFIWVFYIGDTEKCHFLALYAILSPLTLFYAVFIIDEVVYQDLINILKKRFFHSMSRFDI